MWKVIFGLLLGTAILVGCPHIFAAAPPVVTNNVTVAENVSPNQCPSSWEGQTSPDVVNVLSGLGEESGTTSPVIRSCTGCVITAGNCVCNTCYDYFN